MPINVSAVQKALSPNPFCLIATTKPDGDTNLMALSWWTFVSNQPATIAVCLSKKGFSGELIKNTSEFTLSVVGDELKSAAFSCGTCTGRKVNKAKEFGIELVNSLIVKTKIVKALKVALECKVINSVDVNDHIMFIAEIVEAHINPEVSHLYAFNGYANLSTI
jgi:flavin reductase (DIM6/NTAB) family NADH-FMN oxidoreductase RutF